jgi:PIN domain nuclease of toxin-antitoxin system
MGQSLVILLDTHVAMWMAYDSDRISQPAKAAIVAARGNAETLAISGVTLLELATLASKRRIHLNTSVETFMQDIESRFDVLPITGRACARAVELPAAFPKDPADRIIVATALVEGLSLITADREIRRSKVVPTIW